MSDGIQMQEVSEVPQESKEVTEVKQQLDRATIEPEAAIEIGDPKPAELLQEAFVAVMPPVQEQVTPPAPQESAPETGQDSGGKSGFGNQNTNPADHYSGVNMTQGEVLEDNDWYEDGSDPNTVETYTPSLNENQPSAAEHIEGQSEAVEGAAAGLKNANSTVVEMLEKVPDELQEAPGHEQNDNTSDLRGVSEVSSDSDLPAAGQEDAVDMENYFEPERTSLEAEAQTMEPESEDIKENVRQEQKEEIMGPSTESPDLVIESTGAISFTKNAADLQTNLSGTDLRSTEDLIREMEEKLNQVGDDAELADIDLQSALDKQQETIDMLTTMGEVQRDTAETVVRKIALGQTGAGDTTDTGETGEGGENKIVIPAGNSQIDFTGVTEEVHKTDDFTWKLTVARDETGEFRVPTKHPTEIDPIPDRDPSGVHMEIPGNAEDLDLRLAEDPLPYDPDARPEKIGSEAATETRTTQPENLKETADHEEKAPQLFLEITSAAGLRKSGNNSTFIVSDLLEASTKNPGKVTLEDMVLSVLPWPYHKDLPAPAGSREGDLDGLNSSLSSPIITLTSLVDYLEQTAESDLEKDDINQRAVLDFQATIEIAAGPVDYHAAASAAVTTRYGELPEEEKSVLVSGIIRQTIHEIADQYSLFAMKEQALKIIYESEKNNENQEMQAMKEAIQRLMDMIKEMNKIYDQTNDQPFH